ncbi:MAG: lysine 6-aminotransferase, partial [Gemmatimonadota bacterium]
MSVMVVNIIEQLKSIRSSGGKTTTVGLPDHTLNRFAESDPTLVEAIEAAVKEFELLQEEFPGFMARDELDQVAAIQAGIVNFYAHDAV